MKGSNKILVIDFCNFEDYPIGGYLSFVKNMIYSFRNDLVLIGITTDNKDPVGRWFKKEIEGYSYDFFALARYSKKRTKHIIPDRLAIYCLLLFYRKKILMKCEKNVFVQRQEILLAIRHFRFVNMCYCFAGLENPLSISKYRFAGGLAKTFEKLFFKNLKNVKTILASGDSIAIEEMVKRSKGLVNRNSIIQFPTRLNTSIFYPNNQSVSKNTMGLQNYRIVISTTGRLSSIKGWKFLIDCFCIFTEYENNSIFLLIGEGEDQNKINEYIKSRKLIDKVKLLGLKNPEEVALYLNASDLFIMGSLKEGWSTSLSEAIACGTPSCVTNFSSASEIITNGLNGYVIKDRNEDLFVAGMVKALKLPKPVYNENVKLLSSDKLKDDLLKYWKLI